MSDVLTRAAPSDAGVDARGILRLLDALDADPGIRPHGIVVLRDGARIAEGWWAPYERNRVQLLYSVSKSFTSTAAGLARAEGLLDLDATVLSYFPELDAEITDPRSRRMTVRHLAAMSSGHADETIERAFQRDPENLVRGFLLLPPDAEPGTLFAYNQPCTYTLAAIVQRVTGETLVEYLRPRLLHPLGIGEASWIEQPPGQNLGFSGLHSTTDAVARLGELYRCGGVWGERRILDADWVDLATRRHIPTPGRGVPDWEQGYGFQFWMSRHGYRGDGAFGQFCVVVPESGLVVAITSETERMQEVLDAVWTHLLPAIDAPADPGADAELAERLAALQLAAPGGAPQPSSPGEWAGREFAVAAGAPVDGVRIEGGDAGWRVVLTDSGGEVAAPFAPAVWMAGDDPRHPTMAAGGWDDDGDLEVEVLFVETPHTAQVHCSAATGIATVRWLTVPLHSTRPSDQHRP